jgi:hypothetical protein
MYMKKLLASLMLLAATLGLSGSASAVVVDGSTYAFYLEGEQSGNALLISTEFDSAAGSVSRDGLSLSLSESETPVGTASSLITLTLSADGDLFPIDDEGAYLGIGTFDVIDLAIPVTLTDVRITLRDLLGTVVFTSDNLVDFAVNNAPWDGSFPSPTTTILIDEIGGQGVSSVTFDFFVSESSGEVPEPGSVLLCGIGLLAVVAVRRHRRFKA